ncbi:hypothetical protein OYT13_15965 [Pandoraea sp. XJJ-1]|uniref:hypothetical protein n=1 Tax=Pandoraea sp. XJJ-1 TaxID=3002643 RepID=UPI002282DA1B|nr:hypothetical protein [Pandoraea sp. XJJ-1]WAL81347.1 hypothetical protein OYT13_15965 [Pandoraea sp. XJJ-1]
MTYMDPRPEGLNTEPAPKSVVETLKPRTWHKGTPPHVGWWNARTFEGAFCQGQMWGWWNGHWWSRFCDPIEHTAEVAGIRATVKGARHVAEIEWTDYWPENARVPRVNPNEVEA